MEGASEERPRLDPVYRRAAGCAGLFGLEYGAGAAGFKAQAGAELHGHLYRSPEICAANFCHYAKSADEEKGVEVYAEQRMPCLSWEALKGRIAIH